MLPPRRRSRQRSERSLWLREEEEREEEREEEPKEEGVEEKEEEEGNGEKVSTRCGCCRRSRRTPSCNASSPFVSTFNFAYRCALDYCYY